jgi:thiamine biosynthesis protein ThiI
MKTLWLVRYSEIFLKSDPVRREWERTLIKNISDVLPASHARSERGRIWLEGEVDPERLRRVFGIVSFSEVVKTPLRDLDEAVLACCRGLGMERYRTFALRIRRVGDHPFSSHEKAVALGNLIRREFPGITVDLDHPDLELFIEIRGEHVYLYDRVMKGAGGLPLGVEGTLVALVSGGIDSPVAAWMMMKRGCRILPVYVAMEAFLDDDARGRAERVVEVLRGYQPDIRLRVIPDSFLACAREELVKSGLERYTCLLCKRRMYRVAETVAREEGAKGIVTGESLGQVASQTLENLLVLDDAAGIPVYRPLVGLDKEEITRMARAIGTFGASAEAVGGCRAVPKKPSTRAALEKVREIEGSLPCNREIPRGKDIGFR